MRIKQIATVVVITLFALAASAQQSNPIFKGKKMLLVAATSSRLSAASIRSRAWARRKDHLYFATPYIRSQDKCLGRVLDNRDHMVARRLASTEPAPRPTEGFAGVTTQLTIVGANGMLPGQSVTIGGPSSMPGARFRGRHGPIPPQ